MTVEKSGEKIDGQSRIGFYTYTNENSEPITEFIIFLIDGVGSNGIARLKKWALDKKDWFTQAGETLLEKENDKIYIACIWDSDDPNPSQEELSVEAFVSGLEQWDKCINAAPEYIIVKKENSEITIKSSDTPWQKR